MTRLIKDAEILSVSFVNDSIHPAMAIRVIESERGNTMLETKRYVRKPFYIDAVQVNAENLPHVADWAKGDVRTDDKGAKYIKVRVHRPMNDRQTQAFIGDWVLFAGTGYKVYTPKAFEGSFDEASVETTMHQTNPVEETSAPLELTGENAQALYENGTIETPVPIEGAKKPKQKSRPRPRKPAQILPPLIQEVNPVPVGEPTFVEPVDATS